MYRRQVGKGYMYPRDTSWQNSITMLCKQSMEEMFEYTGIQMPLAIGVYAVYKSKYIPSSQI